MSAPVADDDLRFPIGRPDRAPRLDPEARARAIDAIEQTPARFRQAIDGLTETQLDTPYRPGGWSVRQVAHHVPDSHMQAYARFKLALTEHEPTIKPYDEAAWAELADSRDVPVATSMALLEALHARWNAVLRAMQPDDFARVLLHPENGRLTLDQMLSVYSWHGAHHVAHVTRLRERNGW